MSIPRVSHTYGIPSSWHTRLGVTRRIHVIGIGAGDPDYVTAQAVAALNDTQVFFAMDKGDTKDDLVALRRLICERFIHEPGYRFHEMPDPPRARTAADSPAYRQAVADWHAERARLWADAIESELGPGDVGAFLAWGDPSLYDSTLRILGPRRPSTSTSTTTSSPALPRYRR